MKGPYGLPGHLVVELATLPALPRGRPVGRYRALSQAQICERYGVSLRTMHKAKVVVRRGDASLVDALRRSRVTLEAAYRAVMGGGRARWSE
jgi:IS5 family transposase